MLEQSAVLISGAKADPSVRSQFLLRQSGILYRPTLLVQCLLFPYISIFVCGYMFLSLCLSVSLYL